MLYKLIGDNGGYRAQSTRRNIGVKTIPNLHTAWVRQFVKLGIKSLNYENYNYIIDKKMKREKWMGIKKD